MTTAINTTSNYPQFDQESKINTPKNRMASPPRGKSRNRLDSKSLTSPSSPNSSPHSGAFLVPQKTRDDWETVRNVIDNRFFSSFLPDISSIFSVIGNACSSLAHIFKASKSTQNLADILGTLGTKSFLFVNATIKTLEELSRNNYLPALGYFMDNIIATFVPQEHTFLARGLSSGTYHLAHSLSIVNDSKASFKNIDDHLTHLKEGFRRSYKNFFSIDLLRNFIDSNKAMSGVLGGLMMIFGFIIWPLSSKRLATTFRDIGGIFKSSNYSNFGNWKAGRKFIFTSGVMQVLASLADFCSQHIPKSKSFMVPISLGLDGLAKYTHRHSVNRGEIGDV